MNGIISRQKDKHSGNSIRFIVKTFILSFFLFGHSYTYSQAKEAEYEFNRNPKKQKKGFDMERVIVGGSFGMQFGDITLIDISPTVGYLFNDNFLAGIGGRYMYFENNIPGFEFNTNIFGGNIFAQYFFLENFIAHGEIEVLNLQRSFDKEDRINITSVFVGGGYRSSLGGNSFASILVLFNLNDDIYSPYTNPIIRVGFGFGL